MVCHRRMQKHSPLAIIVILFLVVGSLYAIETPDWQAPDEPAHYNYIRQLAQATLPVIEPGDWDQDYQREVISSQFDPQYDVSSFEYEDYQPPLYYLLATPVFWLSDGALLAIRLYSLLIGAILVVMTYVIALRLFPNQQWVALTGAAFIAFIPQHMAILASVNNDSLAELLIAGILLLSIDLSKELANDIRFSSLRSEDGTDDFEEGSSTAGLATHTKRKLVLLGVLLGLGFLTKVTVYIMIPIALSAIVWSGWGKWRRMIVTSLHMFVPALSLGLIWWIRNLAVYGSFDFLGTQAHNAIVVGQPRTVDWISDQGLVDTIEFLLRTFFQSFWGQFGWMGVVMPTWIYQLLLLASIVTIVGFIWALVRRRGWEGSQEAANLAITSYNWRAVTIIFGGTVVLSLLVIIAYNLTFVQPQGRYFFSALVPISIAVALAWGAITEPLISRWPRAAYLIPLGVTFGLVSLDVIALYRFIIPSLTL